MINIIGNTVRGNTSANGPTFNNLKVYIFTFSQSNMGQGHVTTLDPKYQGQLPVYTYNAATGNIEHLQYNVNNNQNGYPTVAQSNGDIGPELSFGYDMASTGQKILIIKYFVVGTSMTLSSPNWSVADNTLYDKALNTIIKPALSAAETFFSLPKADIEIKLIDRYQGEADAGDVTSSPSLFITRHTQDTTSCLHTLAGLGYKVDTCRLTFARIRTFSPSRPHENEIRASIVTLGDNFLSDNPKETNYIADSIWMDSDDLPVDVDGVHVTMAGQITRGQRLAIYAKPYINEVFVPTYREFLTHGSYQLINNNSLEFLNRIVS